MNSGKLIKIIGVIFMILFPLLVVIVGINALEIYDYYEQDPTAGDLLGFLLGFVLSLFPGLSTYAFGSLVDSNCQMNDKMDTLIATMRQMQNNRPAPVRTTERKSAPAPSAPPVYNHYAPPAAPQEAPAPAPVVPPVAPVVAEQPVPAEEWVCAQCGMKSPATAVFCRSCGNKKP